MPARTPARPEAPPPDRPETGAAGRTEPARWVERHGDALFAYALLQVGDRDSAEDLVQETLVAALAARASFRGAASERTWLTGILRHKLVDQSLNAWGFYICVIAAFPYMDLNRRKIILFETSGETTGPK